MKLLLPRTPRSRRQLSLVLDSHKLSGMNPSQRSIVIARLAAILMGAAGVALEEAGDDEQ